jgi:hypothetical protein
MPIDKKVLRELVKKKLKEMSTTAAIGTGAGPIRTPFAFSRPGQATNSATKYAKKMGMKPVTRKKHTKTYDVLQEGQAILPATELDKKIAGIMKNYFGSNLGTVEDREKVRQLIRQAMIDAYKEVDFIVKELESQEEEDFLNQYGDFDYGQDIRNRDDEEMGIYESKTINEVSYRAFKRTTEASPRQKINNAMREIKFMMREIESTIHNALRLKEEMGVKSGDYWKRTGQYLSLVSEKLNKLTIKLKELAQ